MPLLSRTIRAPTDHPKRDRRVGGYQGRVNWTWTIRTRDGGMNGLEFAKATTAGGFERVLIHAAPAQASVEVRSNTGEVVANGEVDRDGDYSPMTLLELTGGKLRRQEIWPGD